MSVKLSVRWLKLPLKYPYRLSFGTVNEYNSIVVTISSNGAIFWGEATALPGYSWESADSIWQTVVSCIEHSGDLDGVRVRAVALLPKYPFAATAVLTAVEKFCGLVNPDFPDGTDRFPLTGIVAGDSPEELASCAEVLLKEGYRVLKVKLLRSEKKDVERLKAIQKTVGSKARLRLDANQSYNYKMVEYLIENITLDNIELLEQPFEKDAWHLVESFKRQYSVPIMLDESIWTLEDIRRASECGVDFVKLKLMKHGSIMNTLKLAALSHELGLKVILGNGVQTDLGCIDECYVYKSANLKHHGEMNGFLKIKKSLSPSGISFKDGAAEVTHRKVQSLNMPDDYVFKEYSILCEV